MTATVNEIKTNILNSLHGERFKIIFTELIIYGGTGQIIIDVRKRKVVSVFVGFDVIRNSEPLNVDRCKKGFIDNLECCRNFTLASDSIERNGGFGKIMLAFEQGIYNGMVGLELGQKLALAS